jgi:anti-sigma regulatory factor (Ser/Thr protein kinase)
VVAAANIEDTSTALLDATLPCDIRVAVTEACTNVAQHAYRAGDADRTVRLVARWNVTALQLLVEDRGWGLASRHSARGPGLGLAHPATRRRRPHRRPRRRRTLVCMTFRLAPVEIPSHPAIRSTV